MMGSGKKVGAVLEGLRVSGVDPSRIGRISSPIGVAIGSHTPEEIAVSIVAQMIAVRNGIEGASLSSNPVTARG
jgi:xanthine dehydrogenase accessory factor